MTNTIAFQRAASTANNRDVFDIFLINDDGTGLERLTTSTPGKEFDSYEAVFSPDGTKIVFATLRNREDAGNQNTAEIYRMRRDGSNVTRLTNDRYFDQSPCWSVDGTMILFAGERPAEKLYTMSSIDGSGITEVPVAPGGIGDRSPSYSPDRTKIAFIRDFGGRNRAVFVSDADGGNSHNLTTLPCLCNAPHWSPDGTKIVYSSDRDHPTTFELEIYEMDATDVDQDGEGDNRIRLTNSGPSISSECPVFSPDGTRIAYTNNAAGKFDIYIMDADGSNSALFQSFGQNCFVSDWK